MRLLKEQVRRLRIPHAVATALMASALGVATPAASAATLTVYVVAADGQPAANVVVQVLAPGVTARVPAEPVVVVQSGVRFAPQVTAILAGTTVRFTNQDPFDHHLRSQAAGPLGSIAPAKDFEFRLSGAKPDKPVFTDVRFERAGLVVLGCHLHSSMRGHLYVAESGLLGVTDGAGRAVIEAVPDGKVELRAWHPEQLLDQAPVTTQVHDATSVTSKLNFTPSRGRRRAG